MELDVLFEDDHLIVVNKPAGLTVHPAPGNKDGTLVNGLLHHCPDLPGISGKLRPGIVHRWQSSAGHPESPSTGKQRQLAAATAR